MSSNSFYPVSPRGSGAPPDHRADTVPPTSMAGGGSYYSGPASTVASSVMGGPANPSATYTPEEKEFHKTFPYVPLSEKVVESYQCSVSRSKVIRIGRLYLTALRMCFVSTFLKEPIHLPWDCVSSIEKKSNFLFEVVLVKRTANAIQQQSEYDLEMSADQKKNSRLSKAAAKDEGGDSQGRFRASSTFGSGANAFTTANGVELSELSTGGAGEDESFTGFITGSSDAAYRMMLMLHSVRARYRRSAALEQIQSPTNEGNNPLSEGPTVNIENKVANLQLLAQAGILESSPLSGAASRSSTVSSQQQGYSAANTNATSPSHGQHAETPREDHDGEELALSGNGSIVDHAASTNGSTPARGTSPAAKPSTASPAAATSVATMAPLSPAKNTFSPTSPAGNATNATTSPAPSPQTSSLTPSVTPVLGPSENSLTPEFIATANHSKDMAVAARASLVTTNANEQIVLQSNLQRAMLTDEQRRKLERGHTHQRSSSMGLGSESMPGFSGEGSSANGVGASAVGGDFSQHESILKAFPLVPRTEIIVDQFQCSYAINVHRIGRLYITGNYLLFSSHFMSEPITIRLVDIERVEKFQTIMVLDGFNIHLRPEATKLTVGQIAQAGGVVPACAIRAGMMTTNPDQGMTGMPVEGSLALAEAAKGILSPALSAATLRTELGSFGSPDVSSGRASPATSQVSRQSANSTPTLSSSSAAINAAGPPPFLAAGLPPSSPLYTSTSPAYGKAVYTFTSFVGSRDQAYGILTHFCQTHTDRVTSIAPLCPKPKDDIVAVSSPTLAPQADESKGAAKGDSPPSAAAPLLTAMGAATPIAVDKINSNGRTWTAFRTSTSKPHFYNSVIQATSQTDISKITTDFAGGLSDLPPFLGKEGAKELMPPLKFPVGADLFDIFYHCFDDDHEILTKYHDDRRDNGQRWEVWRPHLTASSSMGGRHDNGTGMLNGLGGGQREMKSKTVIRVVGEKICDYNEFQRYAFFNIAGKRVLMVQVSGQAQGAMFSDSFRAETMMIFEEDYINGAPIGLEAPSDAEAATANPNTYFNPNRSNVCVTMKCYGYINFLRSVWVRGKILSAALTEMPECYKTLSALMVKRLAEVMATQRAAVSATSSAEAAAGALTLALAPSSQVVEASSTAPDAPAQEHDSGSAAMVPSRAMVGGAVFSTSFRESLSPHKLFSFLATPNPEGGKPKVPAFVVAPAAVLLALVALYCIMCLLDALLWSSSSLPSVELERSRLASRLSAQAAAATGVPVAFQSLTSAADEQQLLTALAISDLYRMALRPVLVPIYGLFSLIFSSLAVEYVLVAKAELGL